MSRCLPLDRLGLTFELDHYLQLEHVMRLAKARAQAYLTHE